MFAIFRIFESAKSRLIMDVGRQNQRDTPSGNILSTYVRRNKICRSSKCRLILRLQTLETTNTKFTVTRTNLEGDPMSDSSLLQQRDDTVQLEEEEEEHRDDLAQENEVIPSLAHIPS